MTWPLWVLAISAGAFILYVAAVSAMEAIRTGNWWK